LISVCARAAPENAATTAVARVMRSFMVPPPCWF
jgi:hypothetical protein